MGKGWRHGSEVKRDCCSFREPSVRSQNTHDKVVQVTSALVDDAALSSGLHRQCTLMVHRNAWEKTAMPKTKSFKTKLEHGEKSGVLCRCIMFKESELSDMHT